MSPTPSPTPKISLIAAMASNRSIGLDNRLPWHLPADLKRFKALTRGNTLVMGRRTFESIGRPLPWRTTIVITRQPGYAPEGALVAPSVDAALGLAARTAGENGGEVFVGGGEEIFRQTLEGADRIYLTRIERDYPGDTFFPEFDESAWRLVEREDHAAAGEAPAFSFLTWDKIRP
jgi:dihydrofolate reductase